MIVISTQQYDNLQPMINETLESDGSIGILSLASGEYVDPAMQGIITYEMYGAKGDGVTNDAEAIRKAHDAANAAWKKGSRSVVRGNPEATYYIGVLNSPIIIQTDVDWMDSTFIIDDFIDNGSGGNAVNVGMSIFSVPYDAKSSIRLWNNSAQASINGIAPITVNKNTTNLSGIIGYMRNVTRSQLTEKGGSAYSATELEAFKSIIDKYDKWLIRIEDNNVKRFLRRNSTEFSYQQDLFVIDKSGTVLNGIMWDYNTITSLWVYPIEPEPLTLKNGRFISYTDNENFDVYRQRNIMITRANVTVDNIRHRLDETRHLSSVAERSNPQANQYLGFISTNIGAVNTTIKNSQVQPHQSEDFKGTYDLSLNNAVNLYLYNVSYPLEAGEDDAKHYNLYISGSRWQRWGVMASSFSKDVIIENCKLNRIDAHRGIWNLIVRNSVIGQYGCFLTGGGNCLIDNVIIDGSTNIVTLRGDYGSTWWGDIIIKNCRFILPPMICNFIGYDNDGKWDFGYDCFYPNVTLQNVIIDNKTYNAGTNVNIVPICQIDENPPHPYNFSDYIVIQNIKFIDGKKLYVFPSASNINRNLYGNATKTQIVIFDSLLAETDISIYNTAQSQFHIIDNTRYSDTIAPQAPTNGVVNDISNTFAFTAISGISNLMEYEYSVNGGSTWNTVMANPIAVGNVDIAVGDLQVRVKESVTRFAGAVLSNTIAFTSSTVFLGGSVRIGGTPKVGEMLTANLTEFTGTPIFEWSNDGLNFAVGTSIYTIADGDIGKTITVRVTDAKGTVKDGSITATSAIITKAHTALSRYGVRVADGQENPIMERLYDAVGMVANVGQSLTDNPHNDFDDIPLFKDRKYVNINGNEMVSFPRWWIRYAYYQDPKDERMYNEYVICEEKYDETYEPMMASLKGNVQYTGNNPLSDYNSEFYVSRYETSNMNKSVSGASLQHTLTRAAFRDSARSIGNGWSQIDISTISVMQALFMIVFATRDSQSIMRGNHSGKIRQSGLTDGAVASCVQVSNTAMSFYGIENLYSNISCWVDGVNTNNRQSYVCTNIQNYADDTTSNYIKIGYLNASAIGFTSKLGYDFNIKFVRLPIETNGSDSSYYCDNYEQYAGWRMMATSGGYDSSSNTGIFRTSMAGPALTANAYTGSRLIYRPIQTLVSSGNYSNSE